MPQFGEVRVDFVTFTTGVSPSEANVTASVSGLIKNPTFSGDVVVKNDLDVEGNITISGTVTGNAAGFTSVTGTTVTGTTANFVTVSGTTVTGDTGNFTTATTTTANVTSGIFASGTAAAPSISVGTTDNGIYSPGSDQLAISTNGTQALYIDSDGDILVADGNRMEIDEVRARDGDGLKLFDDAGAGIFVQDGGNVGIGTSSPLRTLTSAGTSGELCLLGTSADAVTDALIGRISSQTRTYGNASTSSFSSIEFRTGKSTWYNNSSIAFLTASGDGTATAGVERMRLQGDKLGIGTTNPLVPFVLSDDGNKNIEMGYDGSNTEHYIQSYNRSTSVYTQLALAGSAIRFKTGTAATESMRIDSSGRLLVGTSTVPPTINSQNQFVVEQGNNYVTAVLATNQNSANGAYLVLQKSRSTTTSGNTIVSNNDDLGVIVFSGADGVVQRQGGQIVCQVDGTPGSGDMPGRLVFSTTADGASSPTERMRITNYGKTLINQTSAAAGSTAGLEMRGSALDTNYTFAVYDATGTDRVISARNDNHLVSTTTYGRTTAGAANINIDSAGFMARSTSSIKYKTDVETIEDVYSEALLNCRPVWYRSTSERDNPQWGWWGFIAEEVAKIDPRLVHWKTTTTKLDENGELQDVVLDNPEPEGVQYDRFVPHLLNLIKRQKEQIEAMEARLSALESA